MRFLKRFRENRRQAAEVAKKAGVIGWWAILQIGILVWQILKLLRGKK